MATATFAKGVTPVRAGKNVWVRWHEFRPGVIVAWARSPERPEGEGWKPYYPASRVTGDTYEYYDGHGEWEQAANAAMAEDANANFRRGQSW